MHCQPLNRRTVARRIPTHQLGWVGGKHWKNPLEAELDKSDGSAWPVSNACSNAGVAVGPPRIPRPRSRGRGCARFRAHITHRASKREVGPNPRASTRVAWAMLPTIPHSGRLGSLHLHLVESVSEPHDQPHRHSLATPRHNAAVLDLYSGQGK